MKFNYATQTILVLTIIASGIVNAEQNGTTEGVFINLPSSPIYSSQTQTLTNDNLLSCKTDFVANSDIFSSRISHIKVDKYSPDALEYMNDTVKATYNTMRNGVISHVTMKVALSVFNFRVDGFAAENIASYVSEGTRPYLPFKFANGVKITKVTSKGGTIVYRTEMPITKNHSQAPALALAGKVSATTAVCNDMEMVDDLLGRHIVIQYDYYDSNGVFFSSFTING